MLLSDINLEMLYTNDQSIYVYVPEKYHHINNINQIISVGNRRITKIFLGEKQIYPKMSVFVDPIFWKGMSDLVTKYYSGTINQYGARLLYNEDAEIEQSYIIYDDIQDNGVQKYRIWFAIRGRYLKYLYYTPFLGYDGEIVCQGDLDNAVDITKVSADSMVDAVGDKLVAYRLPLTEDGETSWYYDENPHLNDLVDNNGVFLSEIGGIVGMAEKNKGGAMSDVEWDHHGGAADDENKRKQLKNYIEKKKRFER